MKQYSDLDFSKAAKILNVLVDPVAADDTGLGTGQMWFNTTSKFFKGYDGTTKFSLLRDDLAATITGVLTFNPGSGNVPFAVHSSKTDVVQYLNADKVDGYDAVRASATELTCAVRDTGGVLFVATPTLDGHAANKSYVDSAINNRDDKKSCRAATDSALPAYTFLSDVLTATSNGALPSQDGVTLVTGDRLLVKDESGANEKYNGLFDVTDPGDASNPWVLTRASDADASAEVTNGLTTFIEEGTSNGGTGYTLITVNPITINTTALEFTPTNGAGVYSGGNGIVKSGTTFHFGQSASYTVGALPFADGSDSIGFITAVESGKVLKSNGASTAPQWASIDLTADVASSILPVANGGTGTDSQFTQGSVIFAGANGVYTEDSTGLFFDNANNRLGVNTSPGAYTLDVAGTGRFSGQLSLTNNASHQLVASGWSTEGAGASAGSIQIGGTDAYCGRVWFDNATTKLHIGNTYDSSNGDIIFHTRIAGTTVDAVTFKGDGRVGIGVDPTYECHVYKNTNARIVADDGTAQTKLQSSSGLGYVGTLTNHPITFTVNNAEVGRFNTSGFFGINADPSTLFHTKATSGSATIATFETTHSANVFLDLNTTSNSVFVGAKSGKFVVQTSGSSYSDKQVIDTDGRIGWGTDPNTNTRAHLKHTAGDNIFAIDVDSGTDDPLLALRTSLKIWNIGVDNSDSDKLVIAQGGDWNNIPSGAVMTMTTGGSVGFGTTDIETLPSGYSCIQFPESAITWGDANGAFYLNSNSYLASDGSWKYRTADEVSQIALNDNGTIRLRVAASGTIDTAITWTDALTVNNNGTLAVSSTTLVDNLNADTVDGYEASALLDLANSTGDTDDITEGLTNLFYTDARARAALSSTASTEIAYNSSTGVFGLGTEAGKVKAGTLGAGASPTFTHSLGTRNIICQVFRTASPYDEVRPEIKRTDTNTVTVEFIGITPTAGEFTVVCTAQNG